MKLSFLKLSLALGTLNLTAQGAVLVGSLHVDANVDSPPLYQSVTTVTRTVNGNADTRGLVQGDVNIMAGHEIGDSTYDGVNLRTFSANTQYNDLNRFGNDTAGGLITWDFDLSTYLTGKTVGNAIGESQFSLNVEFSTRRSDAREGLWFLSYNGDGLTLDSSDITTHTVSLNTSGVENYSLVTTAGNYQQVLALPANTVAGTSSVDLTAQLATIGAGDGLLRLAYIERDFRGDIHILNESGLVETVVVPEPSTGILSLLGATFLLRRRR